MLSKTMVKSVAYSIFAQGRVNMSYILVVLTEWQIDPIPSWAIFLTVHEFFQNFPQTHTQYLHLFGDIDQIIPAIKLFAKITERRDELLQELVVNCDIMSPQSSRLFCDAPDLI